MPLEKILGAQLGPIGQERDPEKLFLLGEIDRVFEELRTVAVAAEGIVDNEVLEQDHEPAFGRADGEEEIDHSYDRPVPPEDENAPAIRFLKNEAQPLKLFLFIRPEILFFAKKFAEKIRQLIQIFENRRLDNNFAHGGRLVIPQTIASGNLVLVLLLVLVLEFVSIEQEHEHDYHSENG